MQRTLDQALSDHAGDLEADPSAPPATTEEGAHARVSGWLRHSWRYELVFLLSTLGAVVLILSYVYRQAGFPMGQAFGDDFLLTQIYAAHIRHGDIFPIWSTSDGYGLGSPVLLFYQKDFFYVSGVLYLIFGALKTSLVLSMAVFLIIGSYGMRFAISTFTDRKVLLVVGSVGFLFTNYVFTDWLVRGDLPEFTAVMFVPWLVYWCLRLVTKGEVSLLIVPIIVLLVLAHNAIALLSPFLLAVTFVVFLASSGWTGLRRVWRRLAIAGLGIAIILMPLFVAQLDFSKFYDPAVKVHTADANVFHDFVDPVRYLYDGSYQWNAPLPASGVRSSDLFTVQLDFAIWISIFLGGILVLYWWTKARREKDSFRIGMYFDRRVLAVLGGSFLVYMFLQLSISSIVYRVLASLQVIDYPSRSLAFVTPIGVLLCVAVAEAVFRRCPTNKVLTWLPAPWLASLVLLSPLTSSTLPPNGITIKAPGARTGHTYISTTVFTLSRYSKIGRPLLTLDGSLFNEYLPETTNARGVQIFYVSDYYTSLVKAGNAAQSLSGGPCSVGEPAGTPSESLNIELRVKCAGPTRLALPISYNAYTSITSVSSDGQHRSVPYFHLRTDPRIIIEVPNDERETLQISLPTIWRVLF
jgi:hypothetical protein